MIFRILFLFAEETYRFAGVDVEKDLKLTGTIGGHDVLEFDDTLYKSQPKTISGERTFDDVTISGNLNTRGGKVVPCMSGWTHFPHTNKCYKYFTALKTPIQAQQDCFANKVMLF